MFNEMFVQKGVNEVVVYFVNVADCYFYFSTSSLEFQCSDNFFL